MYLSMWLKKLFWFTKKFMGIVLAFVSKWFSSFIGILLFGITKISLSLPSYLSLLFPPLPPPFFFPPYLKNIQTLGGGYSKIPLH